MPIAIVFALVVILTATALASTSLPPMFRLRTLGPGFDDSLAHVQFNTQFRGWLERCVIALQVLAVFTLCQSRLFPKSRWSGLGRFGFATALVGLGLSGTLCAAFGSEFALFAGGAMAILLNLIIIGSVQSHPHRFDTFVTK